MSDKLPRHRQGLLRGLYPRAPLNDNRPEDVLEARSISVVVIGLNEEPNLERCFRSVESARAAIANRLRFWEVIYVDSGSADRSIDIAKRYAEPILTIITNPSAASARNIGLQRASGDYVLFLDGDMALDSDFLAKALDALDQNSTNCVGAVGIRNDRYLGDDKTKEIGCRENVYSAHRVSKARVVGGAIFVRRNAILSIGGYKSSMKVWEDPDLHARFRATGRYFVELPEPFVEHYTEYTKNNVRRIGRLMRNNGPAEKFGHWVYDSVAEGYITGVVAVNSTTFTLLAIDAISGIALSKRKWQSALIFQSLSILTIGLRRQWSMLVLGRILTFGLVQAGFKRIISKPKKEGIGQATWNELSRS